MLNVEENSKKYFITLSSDTQMLKLVLPYETKPKSALSFHIDTISLSILLFWYPPQSHMEELIWCWRYCVQLWV